MKKYSYLFICLFVNWGVHCSPLLSDNDGQLLSNKYARIASEVGYEKAMEMQKQEIEKLKTYTLSVPSKHRVKDGTLVMVRVPQKYVGVRINSRGDFELYDTRNQ